MANWYNTGLSTAPIFGAVEIIKEAGVDMIREKSLKITE